MICHSLKPRRLGPGDEQSKTHMHVRLAWCFEFAGLENGPMYRMAGILGRRLRLAKTSVTSDNLHSH